jgi:hypothetical protein
MLAFSARAVRFVDHPAYVVGQFCLFFLALLLCHNIAAVSFSVAVVVTGCQQVLNKVSMMLLVMAGALQPSGGFQHE